jgi:hypothetical protein
MRRPIFVALSGAALLLSLAGGTVLAGNPSGSGQPNASCEESTLEPNGFSSGGFANADLHYAGNGAPSFNANSDHAVSQYDVACYQVSLHH